MKQYYYSTSAIAYEPCYLQPIKPRTNTNTDTPRPKNLRAGSCTSSNDFPSTSLGSNLREVYHCLVQDLIVSMRSLLLQR